MFLKRMMNSKNSPLLVSNVRALGLASLRSQSFLYFGIDWDDSQTDLAHLGGAAPGAAKSGGDKLWEDNWDDDDIEDEFSVQLRYVVPPIVSDLI